MQSNSSIGAKLSCTAPGLVAQAAFCEQGSGGNGISEGGKQTRSGGSWQQVWKLDAIPEIWSKLPPYSPQTSTSYRAGIDSGPSRGLPGD